MKIMKNVFLVLLLLCSAAAGGVLGGRMFGAGSANAQDGGPMTAEAYQVEDAAGAVRIFVGTAEETSQPVIYMYDEKGNKRAIYSLTGPESLPHFSFWDKAGKVRLAAAVMKDDSASLELLDKNEKVIWHKP